MNEKGYAGPRLGETYFGEKIGTLNDFARRQSSVNESLSVLSNNIDELDKTVMELLKRIERVLSPTKTEAPSQVVGTSLPGCELAGIIFERSHRINEIAECVRATISRLEL